MTLTKLLTPDRLVVPMKASEKDAVITELVTVLRQDDSLTDAEAALQAVLKREADRTTGIGYGLAIPHGKSTGAKRLVMAAGKPADPVDFQSIDGRPVTFVVLLISPPDQTGPHIEALAKVSRLMNVEAFRAAVAQAENAQALHDAIANHEGEIDAAS